MDVSVIVSIAVPCSSVLIAAGMVREQLKQLAKGQTAMRTAIEVVQTQVSGLATTVAKTETSLSDFRILEDERHEKQDVERDDMLGEIRRHGREINDLRTFQAAASERLKMRPSTGD